MKVEWKTPPHSFEDYTHTVGLTVLLEEVPLFDRRKQKYLQYTAEIREEVILDPNSLKEVLDKLQEAHMRRQEGLGYPPWNGVPQKDVNSGYDGGQAFTSRHVGMGETPTQAIKDLASKLGDTFLVIKKEGEESPTLLRTPTKFRVTGEYDNV
jgi:hypothetical protein